MDFDPHAILTRLRGGSSANTTASVKSSLQSVNLSSSGQQSNGRSTNNNTSTPSSQAGASRSKGEKKKKGKILIPRHLHATRTAIGSPGIIAGSVSSPKNATLTMRDSYASSNSYGNTNSNSNNDNSSVGSSKGGSKHSLTHYDTTNEATALEIRTDLERALEEMRKENSDLKNQLKALTREHESLNDDYEAYKSKMGETTSKLRGQIVDQNRQLNEMRILAHPNRYAQWPLFSPSLSLFPYCNCACDDDDCTNMPACLYPSPSFTTSISPSLSQPCHQGHQDGQWESHRQGTQVGPPRSPPAPHSIPREGDLRSLTQSRRVESSQLYQAYFLRVDEEERKQHRRAWHTCQCQPHQKQEAVSREEETVTCGKNGRDGPCVPWREQYE